MMAADVKRLNEAEAIDLDRCHAESDRQQAVSRRQRALLSAAAEDGEARRWAIVKVEARRENDVDNLLSRAMIEHWLPLRRIDDNFGGKRRGAPGQPVWALAWPGYVFVKIADTAQAWLGVRSVRHVTAVLGAGERPFFIDDAKLLKLKAELATLKPVAGPEALLLEGEPVTVKHGPLASLPATVIEADREGGKSRALVEVMIFGRAVPVELDLAQLAKRV